jgi:ketosteroid isomerase-like protein
MTRPLALLLLAGAAASAGCAGPRLPGTDIEETPDTRAIYDVVAAYRQAMEKRDAQAVLALVAPDYLDTAGTPEPVDDLDRARLAEVLPQDLAKMKSLRIDFALRKIEIAGDRARAEVFYEAFYQVDTPNGVVPRRDSDVNQLQLRREGGRWLVTAGL